VHDFSADRVLDQRSPSHGRGRRRAPRDGAAWSRLKSKRFVLKDRRPATAER